MKANTSPLSVFLFVLLLSALRGGRGGVVRNTRNSEGVVG